MEIKHKLTSEVLLTIKGDSLQEVNLRSADLRGADLQEVNLRGADLRGANLRWADLRSADLRGANLRWADLKGADLQEADLRGADLPTDVIRIDGMRWDVTILHGYMRIGCQHHYVDEWESFTDDEISKMHDDALEFWQANKQKLITTANLTKE